ncbi:15369_t:CDS:1, partial [Funneliformis caledonium]
MMLIIVVKQQFQTNHPTILSDINDAPYRNSMVDEGDAQGLLIYHLSVDTDGKIIFD